MQNAISIDLEDWFCVHNLSGAIRRQDWDSCELRVRESTNRLTALFDRHSTKATFFVLGWIAEKIPELIKEIEERGHEIAVHGYNHLLLTEISPRSLTKISPEDLRRFGNVGLELARWDFGRRRLRWSIPQRNGLYLSSRNINSSMILQCFRSGFILTTGWLKPH